MANVPIAVFLSSGPSCSVIPRWIDVRREIEHEEAAQRVFLYAPHLYHAHVLLSPVTLRGRQVVLEPLAPEHAGELWPAASEREIWRYMTFDVAGPKDLETWVAGRLAAVEAGTALAFVQRDAATGEAFGSTSLFDVELEHQRMEIGHTWIGRSHRRTAANTEAKLLLFTHAFDALDAGRVQLKTDARNERSQRAIARLGAVREGVLRRHMVLPDGHVRDTVMYSVVREEWPTVRARLEALLA